MATKPRALHNLADRYYSAAEPTNEELGIVPWTGWRLVAVWLSGGLVGLLALFGIVRGMFALMALLP